jgi:hypothetical protein
VFKELYKKIGAGVLASSLFITTSCANLELSSSEIATAHRLESYGIARDQKEVMSSYWWMGNLLWFPVGTGVLEVKMIRHGMAREALNDLGPSAGFANMVLFPISLAWSIPDVINGANVLNTRETIRYYRFNPKLFLKSSYSQKERLDKTKEMDYDEDNSLQKRVEELEKRLEQRGKKVQESDSDREKALRRRVEELEKKLEQQ